MADFFLLQAASGCNSTSCPVVPCDLSCPIRQGSLMAGAPIFFLAATDVHVGFEELLKDASHWTWQLPGCTRVSSAHGGLTSACSRCRAPLLLKGTLSAAPFVFTHHRISPANCWLHMPLHEPVHTRTIQCHDQQFSGLVGLQAALVSNSGNFRARFVVVTPSAPLWGSFI